MAVTIDNSGITYSDGTKQGSGPSAAADYGQLISITVFTSSGTLPFGLVSIQTPIKSSIV